MYHKYTSLNHNVNGSNKIENSDQSYMDKTGKDELYICRARGLTLCHNFLCLYILPCFSVYQPIKQNHYLKKSK